MEESEGGKATLALDFPFPHVLALSYPSQGHVNPMLQFCKRLSARGMKATFIITNFISKSMNFPPKSHIGGGSIEIDTISDGFDEGGFLEAGCVQTYLERFRVEGPRSFAKLISNYRSNSSKPILCVIYDAFMPWALDVTKEFGLTGAAFFTQPCAVNYIYYLVHHGRLKLPIPPSSFPLTLPSLPLLQLTDMPSFISFHGSYPAYFDLVLNQFFNADCAEFVLVNTFYELETEVVETMSKMGAPSELLTIGPTVPSFYMDGTIANDKDYGLNLFHMDASGCITSHEWLSSKPNGSVVYVSFGSMANLGEHQMRELALAFTETDYYFLWVVRESEESKLPKEHVPDDKCLMVRWSRQLEILSSSAVGCFFSHCGWNSTIEALSLGVPMVVMPQWTDQTTNAKLVQDVWGVGVRVDAGPHNLVRRREIQTRLKQVMEGDTAKHFKQNALKWRDIAKAAISPFGSSHKNIDHFVSSLKFMSQQKTN